MSPDARHRHRTVLLLMVSLGCGLGLQGPRAATTISLHTPEARARCELESGRLSCQHRLRDPGKIRKYSLRVGGTMLSGTKVALFRGSGKLGAVLFLIDISGPQRASTVAKNLNQVRQLITKATSQHRLGLATFDDELHVLAPLGSSAERIALATREVRPNGRTTQLYRNLLGAVRMLAAYPASRKGLIVFSDGEAEDTAYSHADVVESARQHAVAIVGIGFSEDPTRRVYLQSLQRLAEDTSAQFVEAGPQAALPESFLSDPFGSIDSGGVIRATLTARARRALDGGTPLTLRMVTDDGAVLTLAGTAERLTGSIPQGAPPQRPPGDNDPAGDGIPLWYYVLGAAITALIGLAVVVISRGKDVLALLWRSKPPAGDGDSATLPASDGGGPTGDAGERFSTGPSTAPGAADPEDFSGVLGYIELTDPPHGAEPRHAITSPLFRIGRSSDNDLTIHDPSLSRHHAEIQLQRGGRFLIRDLESMNGVYVNDKRVRSCPLNAGDTIELGDLVMTFSTEPGNETLSGEETLVLAPDSTVIDFDFSDRAKG